jgi:PAS domain S-box-containing protein
MMSSSGRGVDQARQRADAITALEVKNALLEAEIARLRSLAGESRSVQVLERITDAFVALDSEWRIAYANHEACRINGKPLSEFQGKTHWEEWPETVGSELERQYRLAVSEQIPVHFEFLYPGENKTWLEVHAYPSPSGLDVIYRPISGRKRAEESFRKNEQIYRAIGESINHGVWVCDAAGKNIYASESFLRLVGFTQQQWSNLDWVEALHPDDAERTVASWNHSAATGGNWSNEHRFRGADGHDHWILARGVPVRDESGRILCWAGINLDIDELKAAEGRLRESESRFRQLADSMPQIIWTARPDGFLDYYNERWYEFTGLERDQFGDSSWIAAMHPDDVQGIRDTWYGCVKSGVPFERECRFYHRQTGHHRWHLGRALPVRDDNGNISKWFGTCIDIHDRKKTEEALRASEARFRGAVDAIGDILWTSNAKGEMAGEQPGWAAFTGQTYAEYQGYGWAAALHPEDAQPTLEEWNRAPERLMFTFRHRVRRNDGAWRLCSVRSVPVLDNGQICEWVGVHTDITDEEQTQQRIRENEARLRQITDAVPAIVWTRAADGQVSYLNQRWYEYTGMSEPESLGFGWTSAVHPGDRERAVVEWRRATSEGSPFVIEVRLRAADGRYNWFLSRGTPLHDASENVSLWLGTSVDINEQKRTEVALRRSNEDLEQFAYAASHDLQEPLRQVATFTQLLERKLQGSLDNETELFANFIIEGSIRMSRLVQDLLTYSRITGERDRVEVKTKFERVLETAIASLQVSIRESMAEITRDPLPVVFGDPAQLTQLCQNLIGNALRYRRPGEPPRIHVSAQKHGVEWLFSVRDNGIGFKQEFAERIFGIFKRLDRKFSGTGIGLAIAKTVVERHGGRIWAESVEGVGSTFYFTLPVAD